uniref:RING-type E3 ubiquitin transferase n=1 Tax=Crassostrea virginica TaxID=6565 RepID=A0A8B8CQH6_CRAVI|nr:peroxisome biogenesis factor 10-like isoform X1 [Crassostrea virginica]
MRQPAGVAEILRSHQKDDIYTGYLKNTVSEVFQEIFGPGVWIRWKNEVDRLSEITYFLLTTVAGYQTVGEEYVNIIQIDKHKRNIPSKLKRLIHVSLHVFGPYGVARLLDWVEKKLQSGDWDSVPMETREIILKSLPVLQQALSLLQRFHLAVFYLRGIFYHIAKRLTDVSYIKFSVTNTEGSSVQQSFKALGWLSLAQLGFSVLQLLYHSYRSSGTATLLKSAGRLSLAQLGFSVLQLLYHSYRSSGTATLLKNSSTQAPSDSVDRKCCLCLETRRTPTATPCGHLFCWQCIYEWCSTKLECPICREKLQPQKLVFLQNFDPPEG